MNKSPTVGKATKKSHFHFEFLCRADGKKAPTIKAEIRGSALTPLCIAVVMVAAIALLCVSNTVFAHDIYSNLRDKVGRYCCNGQDCRPVQVKVLPNGSYYLPTTNEIIPADRATPSPDDRFHHCTYPAVANDVDGGPAWGEVTRCFFAPMHSS